LTFYLLTRLLLTFLIEKNITTIDVLLLSHSDKDRQNVKAFATRFCQAVKPEVVIFSIRDNERQFPTKEVVETVEETLDNVRIFSTRSSEQLHQDGVGIYT